MRSQAARTWKTIVHLSIDPWMAIVHLVVWSVGVSLVCGLAITVVGGAAALAGTLRVTSALGSLERRRANALLDVTVAAPLTDKRPHRFGTIGRIITSTAAWKTFAFSLVQPIVGPILFAVMVAVWSGGLALLTLPLYIRALPNDTARLLITDVHRGREAFLAALVGLALLVAAPIITRGLGLIDGALVRSLLGANREAELAAQVVEVSAQRTAAVDGAEAERRRIERDLHDGAQQRLVALGMTLGLAREKLDDDPAAARALLDEAHADAKAAMTELRAIARGIHPAVLDDRGLSAALSALAAKAPVPVTVNVRLPRRMGTALEGAAYYVVAESLTNMAKHANATQSTVDIDIAPGPSPTLRVVVTDDGKGGAEVRPDGGLAGLRSRVAALGGTFSLSSPVGGPTHVKVEMPCES
jgi:signal transduction histidine kinase